MPRTYLDAISRPDQTVNPLFTLLGVTVDAIEPDRAVLSLPGKPELVQGGEVIAGGVLATLLDETMAHAVLGGNEPGKRTATIDMTASFLRPVRQGDTMVCEAKVIKRGSRVIFVEGCVRVAQKEVARASASFLPMD